jgi:hypothetical protein
MAKFVNIIVSVGLIFIMTTAFDKAKKLTQDEAIKLAEQFIKDNGYSSFPADTSKLSYEMFDGRENDIEKLLKRRQNMLQDKAFCVAEDDERWNVGFLAADIKLSELDSNQIKTDLPGRAVIVYKNGTEIRMAHKMPAFSYFKKLQ